MVPSVYLGFLCVQVSSVCDFCPDTGDEGGHLFGLPCPLCCGEGGPWQANLTGACGARPRCLGHPGLPAHGVCAFPVYTAPVPACSAGSCLKRALGCVHFPGLSHSGSGSRVFPQRRRLGWACVLCPSQVRAAQGQVLGERRLPGCSASLRLPVRVSRVRSGSAGSGVRVSSGKLISGCDPPGGCPLSRIPIDLVSNWEPACRLVEDAVSGAELARCLPALAGARLPVPSGDGRVRSWLALLCCSLSALFCEQPSSALG